MSEASKSAPRAPSRSGAAILALAVLAAVAGYGYYRFTRTPAAGTGGVDLSADALDRRLLAAEQHLAVLTRERAALQQRLGESADRTKLLRDEVLGIGERAALIEDSVRELNTGGRSAQDSLRVNEAELLLTIARERWLLSGDLAGTIQATELAGTAINGLKDPHWLNLRQTIAQELAAYRAVEADPRAIARGELDALEALLPQLALADAGSSAAANHEYGAKRLLNALISIQPTGQQTLITPSERNAAKTALLLEMANARMALQLRHSGEFKGSALRINQWLGRLYVNTPALKERRERLLLAANTPLTLSVPLAGSSLTELQRMKSGAAP